MEAVPSRRFFVPDFKYYGVGLQIVLGWGSALCLSSLLSAPFLFWIGEESPKGATLWPETTRALSGFGGSRAGRALFFFSRTFPRASPVFSRIF